MLSNNLPVAIRNGVNATFSLKRWKAEVKKKQIELAQTV
jgi:hypothetical protein